MGLLKQSHSCVSFYVVTIYRKNGSMKFRSYLEFLNESMELEYTFFDESGKPLFPTDFRKVQFITDSYDLESEFGFKFIANKSLFKFIDLTNVKECSFDLPTLNFAQNSFVQKLIDEKKLDPKKLYNKPADKEVSSRKEAFHKLLSGATFLPKTVYTPEAACKLRFPVIAKPSSGHSGIGITKFDSPSDLKKSEDLESFDLFSEAISIETEIRIVYLKDEIVSYMVREARDEKSKFLQGKAKTMGKQKAEDKLDFVYHVMLPDQVHSEPDFFFSHRERLDKLKEIVKQVREKVKLEYLTLDIAIDKDDKIWVIEVNSEPGSSGVMLANTYDAIFRDFYGKNMNAVSMACLKDVELKMVNFSMKSDKYEFSSEFLNKYIK